MKFPGRSHLFVVVFSVVAFFGLSSRAFAEVDPFPIPAPGTTIDAKDAKCGLWNGFLGMVNILELMNRSDSSEDATIDVFDIHGERASTTVVTVEPKQQLDVVLNSLEAFAVDSYGVVRVKSKINSRMFYYRPVQGDATFSKFDYAFGLELADPLAGISYVSFNTYQPSLRVEDTYNEVVNWLSIVNLADEVKLFQIKKFSIDGQEIENFEFGIAPGARIDVDGGHVHPGPSNVGLVQITPLDASAPYLAQLMRYGYAAFMGFDFAFPLVATAGTDEPQYTPGGSEFPSQNWLEVANVSDSEARATVKFYDRVGMLVKQQSFNLHAHGQRHLNVTSILGPLEYGGISIESDGGEKLIAQSMFYFYTRDSGIASMYGIQAELGTTEERTGSYNLFLGMENYLKITNVSEEAGDYTLEISSAAATGSETKFSLEAHETISLSLHDFQKFGTAPNTYGVVMLKSEGGQRTLSHVVRVRYDTEGEIEFGAPTAMLPPDPQ